MERLIACLPPAGEVTSSADIFIAALGERAQKIAFTLTRNCAERNLRGHGLFRQKPQKPDEARG
jgi:hypothetical protein